LAHDEPTERREDDEGGDLLAAQRTLSHFESCSNPDVPTPQVPSIGPDQAGI
jgi:hypothetical protein